MHRFRQFTPNREAVAHNLTTYLVQDFETLTLNLELKPLHVPLIVNNNGLCFFQ